MVGVLEHPYGHTRIEIDLACGREMKTKDELS